MYARFIEGRIKKALRDTPVVTLNGPRQSGKTTLAKKLAGKDWTYLTLDDPTVLAAAQQDPVGFVLAIDRAVIDEVQRAPALLLAIKRAIDEDRRAGRFLLTGSANILTIPTVSDSLAGRMEVLPLLPLSRGEIGGHQPRFLTEAFRGRVLKPNEELDGRALMTAVLAGGYPEVLARKTERRRQDWCRAYVNAIVRRDVRDIASVAKLQEMPQLLQVLAQLSGQLLNLSEIGGHLRIDHKTADRYVGIMEQLFLVGRLQPWFRNELKRLVKTPKLHFLDTGLLASLRRQTVAKLAKVRQPFGAILESFVYAELLKQASWADERISFFHYRDKDQEEVDFVLENERGSIVGVEVKAAASVNANDFRGLNRLAAGRGTPFKCGIVLYDGKQVVPFGGGMFAAPLPSLWA